MLFPPKMESVPIFCPNAIINRVPDEILSKRKKDYLLELIISKRRLLEEVFI